MAKTKLIDVTHKNAGPTRRTFLTASGAVAAAAAVTSGPLILVPGKAKAADKLVFATWGGQLQEAVTEAYIKPFTKETGVEVVVTGAPDMAKLMAQAKSGNIETDIAELNGSYLAGGEKAGLFEPVDGKIVDRSDIAVPLFSRPMATAYYTYAGGIGYSEERSPGGKHPTTWPEFWDPKKFPGRRGLRTRPGETFEVALMGDGVAPGKVYPIDVDRAFKALDKIKPYVTQWIAETPKTVTLIQTNEIDFTHTYNGRVYFANREGAKLGFSFKQNYIAPSWLAVVKGSSRRDLAFRYMASCLKPERQARFAQIMTYSPSVKAADKLIPPDIKKVLPDATSPDNCIENLEWWADKNEEMTKRFKEWQMV
jgi:putative spermidine/putrescine transport system substrate-binding protein